MDSSLLQKKIEIPKLSERTKGIIRDVMFLAGLVLAVVGGMLSSSMFDEGTSLRYYLQLYGKALIIAKLLIFDHKNKWVWIVGLPVIIFGKTLYSRFGYYEAMTIAVTAVGAVGVKFEKIVKTFLFTSAGLLMLIIGCSLAGVIEDLQYPSDHGVFGFDIRHSFGIVYPTDFASYVFFIMTAFLAAFHKNDKLHYLRAAVLALTAAAVYCLCITRLDCLCMLLLSIGLVAVKLMDGKAKDKTGDDKPFVVKLYEKACIVSMPVFAAFFVTISFVYSENSELLKKLNDVLSGRLALGRSGFEKFGVPIFGQFIYMVGYGGSTDMLDVDYYFFLDSSYVNAVLRFGLVFTALLIAAFVVICLRYRSDHIMLLCCALVALNCMIAHHLADISFDFMITAVAAEGGISLKELFCGKNKGGEDVPSPDEAPPAVPEP